MGLDELQSPQQNQAPPASLLHQRHQKWESVTPLSDLPENFQTTRQAVSKHLRLMTECELVKQECKGREIFYSLKIEKNERDRQVAKSIQKDLGNAILLMKTSPTMWPGYSIILRSQAWTLWVTAWAPALRCSVRSAILKKFRKVVVISAPFRRDGWVKEANDAWLNFTWEVLKGTPAETEWKKLNPTPDGFQDFFNHIKVMALRPYDLDFLDKP